MIGKKIKYYRKQMNLTLQEISNRTGLSVGYLSNLERGLTSPTFDNLGNICDAMSISLVDLVMDTLSHGVCVKKEERKAFPVKGSRAVCEYTSDLNLNLLGFCMTLPADDCETQVCPGPDGDELGVVTKGSVAFEISGETYPLREGDTVYLRAGMPHKWRRTGEGECVIYWTKINYIRVPPFRSHPRPAGKE